MELQAAAALILRAGINHHGKGAKLKIDVNLHRFQLCPFQLCPFMAYFLSNVAHICPSVYCLEILNSKSCLCAISRKPDEARNMPLANQKHHSESTPRGDLFCDWLSDQNRNDARRRPLFGCLWRFSTTCLKWHFVYWLILHDALSFLKAA